MVVAIKAAAAQAVAGFPYGAINGAILQEARVFLWPRRSGRSRPCCVSNFPFTFQNSLMENRSCSRPLTPKSCGDLAHLQEAINYQSDRIFSSLPSNNFPTPSICHCHFFYHYLQRYSRCFSRSQSDIMSPNASSQLPPISSLLEDIENRKSTEPVQHESQNSPVLPSMSPPSTTGLP